jgi:hypothetical protein
MMLPILEWPVDYLSITLVCSIIAKMLLQHLGQTCAKRAQYRPEPKRQFGAMVRGTRSPHRVSSTLCSLNQHS